MEFEEGIPKRMIEIDEIRLSDGADLDVDSDLQDRSDIPNPDPNLDVPTSIPSNRDVSSSPVPSTPTAPLRRSTHIQNLLNLNDPPMASTPEETPTPMLCRSARLNPTSGLINSVEEEDDEEELEQWVNVVVLASMVKGGGDIKIPKSYVEAMSDPEWWLPPMQKEIELLESRKCWSLVERPPGAQVLKGMF